MGSEEDRAGYTTRRIVMTTIVTISRIELALYLFIRVLKRGKDARFDEMREKFFVSTLDEHTVTGTPVVLAHARAIGRMLLPLA